MSTPTATPGDHYEEMLSVRAQIAALEVFEAAAEADGDRRRYVSLVNVERDLWDTLVHFNEVGVSRCDQH